MVLVVGDAEAGLQSDVGAKLAQQLGAEGVNRSPFDALGPRLQPPLETRGDLSSRLVREREDADALRIESSLLDEESDPLDQAERLARAGTGENKDRLGEGLDGLALGVGRNVGRIGRDGRSYGGDRVRSGKAGGGSGQVLFGL